MYILIWEKDKNKKIGSTVIVVDLRKSTVEFLEESKTSDDIVLDFYGNSQTLILNKKAKMRILNFKAGANLILNKNFELQDIYLNEDNFVITSKRNEVCYFYKSFT